MQYGCDVHVKKGLRQVLTAPDAAAKLRDSTTKAIMMLRSRAALRDRRFYTRGVALLFCNKRGSPQSPELH